MAYRKSRREDILAAAVEAFADRGFADTSIGDLAVATGLSKAAIGYHFAAKDDLMRALVEPLLDRLESVLAAHPPAPAWPDGVRRLLATYFAVLVDLRQVVVWVDGDRSVLGHPQLGRRLEAVNQRMRVALVGDQPTEEELVRASAALGNLWRPLGKLTDIAVGPHTDTLIDAVMASLGRGAAAAGRA